MFCLGSGGGISTEVFHLMGVNNPASIAEVREYGLAVKGLCAGEEVQYKGPTLKIR